MYVIITLWENPFLHYCRLVSLGKDFVFFQKKDPRVKPAKEINAGLSPQVHMCSLKLLLIVYGPFILKFMLFYIMRLKFKETPLTNTTVKQTFYCIERLFKLTYKCRLGYKYDL